MNFHLPLAFVLMVVCGICLVHLDGLNVTPIKTNGQSCECPVNLDDGAYTRSGGSTGNRAKTFTIFGNHSCSCVLSVRSRETVTLEVMLGTLTGMDYLSVEKDNKYIAFKGLYDPCEYRLVPSDNESEVKVHLRADITVILKNEIRSSSTARPDTCMEPKTNVSQSCCKVVEYSRKISCVHSITEIVYDYIIYKFTDVLFDTRCGVKYSSACNGTIGHNEIIYQCGAEEGNTKALLVFPINVTHLNLSHNHLISLTSDAFSDGIGSQVKRLDVSGNALMIDSDTFRSLRNLDQLDLSGNDAALTPHVFGSLSRLRKLMLNGNRLANLSNMCERLSALEELYVIGNQIFQLDPGSFHDCVHLIRFDLSKNKLQILLKDTFKGLTSLLYLFISNNELLSILDGAFEGLGQLTNLNLGSNNLTYLSPGMFKGAHKRLRTLALWRNEITRLRPGVFLYLSNLLTLNLNHNQLSTLENGTFCGLSKLHKLYLSENSLVYVDLGVFDCLTNLEQLYLAGNRFKQLTLGVFRGLDKLSHLNLNDNRLRFVDNGAFWNLQRLEYLSLNGNRLGILSVGMFDGLRQLMYLHLRANRLTKIARNTFDEMVRLHTLDLSGNMLRILPTGIFNNFINAVDFNLSFNDLQDLPWMGNMSRLIRLTLIGNGLTQIYKDKPNQLSHKTLVTVDQPQVCFCYLTVNCTATYPKSAYFTCGRLLSKRVLAVFLWILGCSSLIGNIFVLSLEKFHRHKEISVQTLLIQNLAISDLIMGIYMIIIASADIFYGESFPMHSEAWRTGFMCKIAGALAICSSEASVLFVTLISLDRFHGMRYPYSARRLRGQSTKVCSAFIWLFASIVGTVPSILAGINTNFYDNSHVCIGLPLVQKVVTENQQITIDDSERGISFGSNFRNVTVTIGHNPGMHFSTVIFCGFNLLCFLIIFCCYVDIVNQVYRSLKQSGRRRLVKQEISLNLKVAAIVATDFFCWFPIIIGGILVQSGVVSVSPAVCAWAITFVLPINSAINPYLYTISFVVADSIKKRRRRIVSSGAEQHDIPLMIRATKQTLLE